MTTELHFIGKDGQTRRIGKCSNLEITPEPTLRVDLGERPGMAITRERATIKGSIQADVDNDALRAWMASLPPLVHEITITFDGLSDIAKSAATLGRALLKSVRDHFVIGNVPLNRRDRQWMKRRRAIFRGARFAR